MARGDIRTGFWPMLGRALLRRCPRCGGAGWFTGWFAKGERCRTCGYRYEREPGFLVGALTINTVVTFGLLAVVLVVGSILTYPHIAVVPIIAASVAVAVVVPVLGYPFSYTIWAAVDLTMRPPRAGRSGGCRCPCRRSRCPLAPLILDRTLVRSYAGVVRPGNSVTPLP